MTNVITRFTLLLTIGCVFCISNAHANGAGAKGITIDVSGSNLGSKINAANRRLGDHYGVIKVVSPGSIDETILVSPHHTLEFVGGTWSFSKSPGIRMGSYTLLKGAGTGETTLAFLPKDGSLVMSVGYNRLHGKSDDYVLHGSGKVGTVLGARHIRIDDLTLSGSYASGRPEGSASAITIYGFWFKISNALIHNFPGNGVFTEYVYAPETSGTNAVESFVSDVKILDNGGTGWVVRGPHDSIVNGLISALNARWGIEVEGKRGFYGGGGLMLTNVHAYGNTCGGVRVGPESNILAFGLESEANYGPGVLLLSNDNIVHGEFYSNRTYGIQIGLDGVHAGANYINGQWHNNGYAQIAFTDSAGYNYVEGMIYASGKQKYLTGTVTAQDFISAVVGGLPGPPMVRHIPGVTGWRGGGKGAAVPSLGDGAAGRGGLDRSVVLVRRSSPCSPAGVSRAEVTWSVGDDKVRAVNVYVRGPRGGGKKLFASGGSSGSAGTGDWTGTGVRFDLVDANSGRLLATDIVPASYCEQ